MMGSIHWGSMLAIFNPYNATTDSDAVTEDTIAPTFVAFFQNSAARIGIKPPDTNMANAKSIKSKIPFMLKAKMMPRTPIRKVSLALLQIIPVSAIRIVWFIWRLQFNWIERR